MKRWTYVGSHTPTIDRSDDLVGDHHGDSVLRASERGSEEGDER